MTKLEKMTTKEMKFYESLLDNKKSKSIFRIVNFMVEMGSFTPTQKQMRDEEFVYYENLKCDMKPIGFYKSTKHSYIEYYEYKNKAYCYLYEYGSLQAINIADKKGIN